eukprot:3616251-Pleurochrysis_carterae.AAC.5
MQPDESGEYADLTDLAGHLNGSRFVLIFGNLRRTRQGKLEQRRKRAQQCAHHFGEAEVEEHEAVVAREANVVGLEVAVQHGRACAVSEGRGCSIGRRTRIRLQSGVIRALVTRA